MVWTNSPQSLALFSVGLSLELLLVASLPTPVQAQSELLSPSQSIRITFEPPGRGKPKSTAGGASRDGGLCPQDATELSASDTPFLPAADYGLTLAERPTFFVSIPETVAQQALFIIKDQQEDYFYQKTVQIPNTPGIVSIELPSDAPALEIGKSYQWSFIILCGQTLRPDSPGVNGQIQRIEADTALMPDIEQLSPLERVAFYGKEPRE